MTLTDQEQDEAQAAQFDPEAESAARAEETAKTRRMGRPTHTERINGLQDDVDAMKADVGDIKQGLERVLQAVSDLTIQGRPLPMGQEHLVPYAVTDQGRAEAEAARVATGKPEPSGVRITRGEFDNSCERFGDAAPTNWTVKDPLTETAERYKQPGYVYRFLNDPVIEKLGMRNWEFVKDPGGQEVKNGGMRLARMPQALKDARDRHYEELNKSRARDAEQKANEQQERLLRQAAVEGEDVRGAGALRPGDVLRRHDGDGEAFIGLHTTRGLPQVAPTQI